MQYPQVSGQLILRSLEFVLVKHMCFIIEQNCLDLLFSHARIENKKHHLICLLVWNVLGLHQDTGNDASDKKRY